ncbi:conserved unknown protein [Ectocarpus siliculosus]|uniref:CRC domain-containing protein n=1 Tax=Ectocarpus siliculosus TaxID=2880 RepID=D7FZ03_ECTSI|nr:conserved unknown protein [Ectocarpus siliculosus]|eukprot:CBJ32620.1 conserved unknown protein [Ectocarpus siliculosus]
MCLKLYCQCFAGQLVCSDACRCENCYNSAEHGVERRAAVRELLCRSPHAFDAKFKTEPHPLSSSVRARAQAQQNARAL